MAQKDTWIKPRHKVVVALLAPIFGLYVRAKYGVTIRPFKNKQPHLIVMNHQTAYDQFFVSLSLMRPVYYLASEDIFSMGWLSRLIEWLVAPIPIKKQTMDVKAIKNCIRVAREGGTICLAPEGNRTYHGRNVYINPAIAGLTKKLGMPLAIYRIDGGYGIHPRWSDVVRRGKMQAGVTRVIQPEEYADLSNEELFDLIQKELYADEAKVTGRFVHKKNAEFLERVLYVCPWCGLSTFESHDDVIHCTKCGRKIRHLPTKELQGIDCDFPHRFVADWYEYQQDFVNGLDTLSMTEQPLYEETAAFYKVKPYKYKTLLNKQVTVRLYGDRITVDDMVFPFESDAVVILGKNKINLYHENDLFQLKGSKRFNGLKYLNFSFRYKNLTAGGRYGKHLGL
jgi:1-acyl-sn-glycerol-3-phosphate acyltransferase